MARIDQALIDVVETALLAGRTRLGLSFPRAVIACASMTIIMMALSAFLSSGDLVTVKIPLLALYAVLAFAMGRTVFRHLDYFDDNWTPEIERGFAKSAMENRAPACARNFLGLRLDVGPVHLDVLAKTA